MRLAVKFQMVLMALLLGLPSPALAQPKGGPPAPTVYVERVREATIAPTSQLLGTVMPPRKTVVGSAVEGRVEEVPIREGDAVQGPVGEGDERVKGQTLAQVLTETIKIEVRGAEAELKLLKHELEQIKLAEEDLVLAETKLKVADAQRVYAKAKLERAETLYKLNRVATKQDFDEAVAASEAAEQIWRGAASSLKLARAGHPEKVESAKARVAVQQEEVNRLEDRLRKYTARAPFDGYVSALHTEAGAWIRQGDPVAEVIELAWVDVVVAVPESYIVYIHKGDVTQVEFDALPGRQKFPGEVSYIVPQADHKSRTFPVKIKVENRGEDGGPLLKGGVPLFKAGMLARAELAVGVKERGTVVPRDALVLDKEHKFVFVATPDPKTPGEHIVRRERVELGPADKTLVLVRGQVKPVMPGDLVVIEGNERLRDGQNVKVKIMESTTELPQARAR